VIPEWSSAKRGTGIQDLRSAISQNWHITATESSLQAFNLPPWTLTLYILRFFQSQWFLKKFAPREKCSRPREMRRLVWESFFAKWKTILRIAKATLGGELGFSLCPRCWPPELVATDLDGELNCPVCGRVSYEQAA
jgi:hypothetical protein